MSKFSEGRRLGILGVLTGALSGCLLNPDALPPNKTVPLDQLYHSSMRLQPSVVEPQVETVDIMHTVEFPFGSDTLSDSQVERLAAFLREARAGQQARIVIDGPRKAAGRFDILTEARIAAIADAIADQGFLADISRRPVDSLSRPADSIVVAVSRAMVIEPDCEVPKTIYVPRPTHIWSCSTAVALGRMVVDPMDLKRGRPLGPADGETLSRGIERYRTDKVKVLKSDPTQGE